jgi:DNA-binding transcriptional regulator YhcF (GntR family)
MRIDVALSRQQVLNVIKRRIQIDESLTLEEVALEIGCHPNTVWRAIKDLQNAGKLRMIQRGRRFTPPQYEILGDENADHARDA